MQASPRIDELRQKFHENPRRYFAPLANEYRKAGDPEQAIAICRAHLAQQPGHMSGHVVYGQALYDARRMEEARVVFEKALSLDPDNAVVLKQLGDIARQNGDTGEARHWYTRALDADPQDSQLAAYIAELTEPLTEAAGTEREPGAEVTLDTEAPSEAKPSQPDETIPGYAGAATVEDVNDAEVPLLPVAREPEVAAAGEEENAAPMAEEQAPWRKTPPGEDSPFVTRTMAELYAKQGYRAAALDVYRQLALQHPDDVEIQHHIDELSREPTPPAAAPTGDLAQGAETSARAESEAGAADVVSTSASPAAEPGGREEPEPFTFAELSDGPAYAPSSEDLNLSPIDIDSPFPETPAETPHFTETELQSADSWESDSWAAGFAQAEGIDLAFDSPEVTLDSAGSAPAGDLITDPGIVTPQARPEEPAVAEEPVARESVPQEPATQEPATQEPEAEMPPAEEPFVQEPPRWEAESVSAHEPAEAEPDESHLVAYSPQPPADAELPHFAPKGPTVREFFATLGARRPPAHEPRGSFSAHAAVPSVGQSTAQTDQLTAEQFQDERPPLEERPLAGDAFASLFPDEPVAEEDTRAAFALSGALGAASPVPEPQRTPCLV
jgi:tetratricopeptide (TPR) repeat protein